MPSGPLNPAIEIPAKARTMRSKIQNKQYMVLGAFLHQMTEKRAIVAHLKNQSGMKK